MTKWLLGAVLVCLAILIWRVGSPLQLQIVGPIQSGGGASGIPLALNMNNPTEARYAVELVTDIHGAIITKVDRYTGTIEIYRVDSDGKMRLTDTK